MQVLQYHVFLTALTIAAALARPNRQFSVITRKRPCFADSVTASLPVSRDVSRFSASFSATLCAVLGELRFSIQYAILRSSDARQTTAATPPRAGSCNAKPATAITSVGIHSNGINAIKYGSGKWPSQPAGISPSAIHTTQIINAIQSAIIIQATPPMQTVHSERTYANSEPPSVASLPDSDDSAM